MLSKADDVPFYVEFYEDSKSAVLMFSQSNEAWFYFEAQ